MMAHSPRLLTLQDRHRGRYDIVGDVHGCWDELADLLAEAGWRLGEAGPDDPIRAAHPDGRFLVLAGDLVDRGPASDRVLRLLLGLLEDGTGAAVLGNHDWKFLRWMKGRDVTIGQGLEDTIRQTSLLSGTAREAIRDALFRLPHQLRLPMPDGLPFSGDGYLTIVHAAAPDHHLDQETRKAFKRAIYGYPGGTRKDGSFLRDDWAAARGEHPRWIIHGHETHAAPRSLNRVVCIDTACVYGHRLTMLRAETGEFFARPARANHAGIHRNLF